MVYIDDNQCMGVINHINHEITQMVTQNNYLPIPFTVLTMMPNFRVPMKIRPNAMANKMGTDLKIVLFSNAALG